MTRPRVQRMSSEQAAALLVEGRALLPLVLALLPTSTESLVSCGFPQPAVFTAILIGQDEHQIARRRVRGKWVAAEQEEENA